MSYPDFQNLFTFDDGNLLILCLRTEFDNYANLSLLADTP